jgi:hypothetical protein
MPLRERGNATTCFFSLYITELDMFLTRLCASPSGTRAALLAATAFLSVGIVSNAYSQGGRSTTVELMNGSLAIHGSRYSSDFELCQSGNWIWLTENGNFLSDSVVDADDINSIFIDLGSGDDHLNVFSYSHGGEFTFSGTLQIASGQGTDIVEMPNMRVENLIATDSPSYSSLTVNVDESHADFGHFQGADVTITDSTFGDALFVLANTQDVHRVNTWDARSYPNRSLVTDRNWNQVQANRIKMTHDSKYNCDDDISLTSITTWTLDIDTGIGADYVYVGGSYIAGNMSIKCREGKEADMLYLSNSDSQGSTTLATGGGADLVYLIQCEFESNLDLNTLDGNDYSFIYNSDIFGVLTASMGDHNDRLRIRSTAIAAANLRGDGGKDELNIASAATFGGLSQNGFETVID